jgi:hypothetical protein
VASGAETDDVVAVDRGEVAALCLAALDTAGASRRVAEEHIERLAGSGVRLPGSRRTEPPTVPAGRLALRADVLAALRRRAGSATTAGSQEGTSSGEAPVKGA